MGLMAGIDPKLLAGLDPKLFAGLDPRLFGFDPKMFDPKTSKAAAAAAVHTASAGLDPRLLGLDPKMLQGLDSKALQSLGLDPKIVASLLDQQKAVGKPPTTRTTAKI